MKQKVISKADFNTWVDILIGNGPTIGVREKGANKFEFAQIFTSSELRLDYDVTILSPKKYLQPPRETLLRFNSSKAEAASDAEKAVIIGVHPYDMHAINQMDRVFSDDNKDTNYLERRKGFLIIGIDPVRASKWSFWGAMDTETVHAGFDLWLTDLGDRYFIEIGGKNGERLLKSAVTRNATKNDIASQKEARLSLKDLCKKDRSLKVQTRELPSFISLNYHNKIWEDRSEKCYSCGSCNMVCPTCYCFDVRDEFELDLKRGKRVRLWDGCLLEEFAKIGSGENFREDKSERFRHRIFRKFVYMPEKIGDISCVGCGRCSSVCLPDITDPVKIINELKD